MKFYFGPLKKLDHLFDLTVNISGTSIICPKKSAVKLVPKIRIADMSEDDLKSVNFDDITIDTEENLQLAKDILSEKAIWLTPENRTFLTNFANYFEISELSLVISIFIKCHKLVDKKKINHFISQFGQNSLLEAAASQDAQFVYSLLETGKVDINHQNEKNGVLLL